LFENADDIEHESLKKLNYVNNLIKEVLRLYNPAPGLLPRTINKSHKCGEIEVLKGGKLLALLMSNTNPKYFENPD